MDQEGEDKLVGIPVVVSKPDDSGDKSTYDAEFLE